MPKLCMNLKWCIIVILPLLGVSHASAEKLSAKVAAEIDSSEVVLYSRNKAALQVWCKIDQQRKFLPFAESLATTIDTGCLILVKKKEKGGVSVSWRKVVDHKIVIEGEKVPLFDVFEHLGVNTKSLFGDLREKKK